jgi:hypothetical protein
MQFVASSRLTQFLLLLILSLQLWVAFGPAVSANPVKAAGSAVQYKALLVAGDNFDPGAAERVLNAAGQDGWALVACPNPNYCILKK